jgi:hypothetical protein
MALKTYSKFYYGHTITDANRFINFKENGGTEQTAILNIGEYSLTDFCTEVARALNGSTAAFDYGCSVNRSTRFVTITCTGGNVQFLPVTGSQAGSSAFSLIGIVADTSNAGSHTGTVASGSEWAPQFKAQDYVSFEDNQKAVDGVVRKTTSGKVEAVSFGVEKIMECNFRFITNIFMPSGHFILSDSAGYENAREFLKYAITKADLEFMPNVDDVNTFNKCLLESTPDSPEGLGFKLRELYSIGLPEYYETGILRFRLID